MKINSNIVKIRDYFNNINNKIKNLEDSIPFIQNEIILDGIKPNIREDIIGNSIQTSIPYSKKNQKELKKLIESDHVLPVKQISQIQHPRIKNYNFNKITKPKKINFIKLKREIANLSVTWLFNNK